jgi:hypothetical protein
MSLQISIVWSMVVLGLAGCNWVDLRPDAEGVAVADASSVANCELRGTTTASVLDRVGFIDRSTDKVQGELSILARNSALDIGGDTVVPTGRVENGKQKFAVYKCRR